MTSIPEWWLGIDVGGTKTALAAVAFPAGTIHARRTLPTPPRVAAGAPFLAAVVAAAGALTREVAGSCRGIGIAICELVDHAGRITSAVSVPWGDLDVAAAFADLAPAVIESDVRAAALADARLGAGRGLATVFYVNVGTGLSSTVVIDGTPLRGAHGNAILFGELVVGTTPGRTTLEAIASGGGLQRSFQAATGLQRTASEIMTLEQPDAVALRMTAFSALADGLRTVHALLDPDRIVIGGGLGSSDIFWQGLVATATGLPLTRAELGGDAGAIGAALTAAHQLERAGRT